MLTNFDYGRIKQAYDDCKTVAGAARATGFSRKAVAKAVASNFEVKPYKRAPNKRTKEMRKEIVRIAKITSKKAHRTWPRYSSCKQMQGAYNQRTGRLISVRTVSRALRHAGLKPYVRKAHPTRSRSDLLKKKAFAQKHRNIEWQRIVFSDESWLCCNERTGRLHWTDSQKNVLAIEKKARWNVPSILVWGSVGYDFKGPLIIFPSKVSKEGELRQFRLDSQSYVRRCLSTIAPKLKAEGRLFQQDGARSHIAKGTMGYLARKRIDVLADWPPYCPDLNAIERIWKELNARVGARCPMTMVELVTAAKEEWEALPQSIINSHCAHFPKQLRSL